MTFDAKHKKVVANWGSPQWRKRKPQIQTSEAFVFGRGGARKRADEVDTQKNQIEAQQSGFDLERRSDGTGER